MATWERLAHVTASGAAAEVTTGTFSAYESLKVETCYTGTGTGDPFISFNGDEAGNYSNRYSRDGGSDSTDTSQSIGLRLQQGTTTPQYSVINITNISDKEKLVVGHTITQGSSGAGNAPTRQEFAGKWANTSANITEITLDRSSDNFAAGSYITVWGANPAPATADTITVSDLTAKKHLMIQAKTISDGQVTANYRFNADSGSNYARRQSSNGGSDGTGTSQNVILAGYGTSGETTFITTNVINEATKEKLVITELVTNGSGNGAGNAPNRREIVGKWSNTSNAITSVTLFNNDTGSFAEGTEVTVYGTD